MDERKKEEIGNLVSDKVGDWREKVENTELDDLRLNIFLASAMDMNEPRELIEWGVHQHLERSLVTSFGFLIEKIVLIVSEGKKHDGEGGDIVLERNNKKYYIEVKSGTASSNVKMMRNTSNVQAELKRQKSGEDIVTVLGLTYGKPEDLFSTMEKGDGGYYKGDELLIGKEFWEFLADEDNAHKQVLETIVEAREEAFNQSSLTGETPSSIQEAMELKIDELTEEWENKHGEKLTYDRMTESFF